MFMFSVWMMEGQISVGHVAEIRNETKIYGALLIVSCVTQFQSHRCFCSLPQCVCVCVCNGLLFSIQSEHVKLAVHEQVFNDNICNVFLDFQNHCNSNWNGLLLFPILFIFFSISKCGKWMLDKIRFKNHTFQALSFANEN